MKQSHVRALIEEDLDVIEPDSLITADNKIVMYMENQDGIEKLVHGWNLIVSVNDIEIDKCIQCKNGKDGWAEFIDEDLNMKRINGDVRVYICVPFEAGAKPPRVDIIVSDIERYNKTTQAN